MLKKTLIAAAAVWLMAFGATDAFAGKGGGHGGGGHGGGHGGSHGGGKHGGGKHGGGHHGGGHHGHHRGHGWHRSPSWWFGYSWYPRCHYEPRKVRIKVWDRRGRPHFKWVWRDVRVCD